jgi:hypothetical protein
MTQFLRVLNFSPSLHVECVIGLWNPIAIVGVTKNKQIVFTHVERKMKTFSRCEIFEKLY